jgi:hypothetical protein
VNKKGGGKREGWVEKRKRWGDVFGRGREQRSEEEEGCGV